MSDDKKDATFHPHDRPWADPGAPPWAGEMVDPPRRFGLPVWAWVGIVTILVISMALLCGGLFTALAGPGGQVRPGSITEAPPSASEPAAVYRVGKTFRSGDFQYTIHGVKTGVARVGDQYSRHNAQGSFTRLDITVKNVGEEPMYFYADSRVKVEDKAGRRFSSDGEANVFGNSGQGGWMTEVNPGNSLRAFAFFDLPKGTAAARVVVSAGMLTFEADAVVPLA